MSEWLGIVALAGLVWWFGYSVGRQRGESQARREVEFGRQIAARYGSHLKP